MAVCYELNLNFEKLNIKRICSNYGIIRDMVNQGIGWAVLPSHIEINKAKCETLNLKGRNIPHKDFYLIFRKETTETKWFKDFTKEVKESL